MRSFVLASLFAMCACGANPAPPDREIRTLLADQAAAWTRGDLESFCTFYADDATFLSPSGLTEGRKAVHDRYRKKYVDKSGMGSLTLEVKEVRAATATNASVVARWTLTWPDRPKAEGLTLIVLWKMQDGWRIVQDASM